MYCCVSGEGTFQHLLAETSGLRRGLRVAGAVLRGMCKRQPKLIGEAGVSR